MARFKKKKKICEFVRSKDIFKNRGELSLCSVEHMQDLCRDWITPCKGPPAAESRDTLSSAKASFIFPILHIFSYHSLGEQWMQKHTKKKMKMSSIPVFKSHFTRRKKIPQHSS